MSRQTPPRWPGAIDGASDGLLVAFAAWTVFYQAALVFQFSMLWAGWPWLVLALALAAILGVRGRRPVDPIDPVDPVDATDPGASWVAPALGLALLAAVAVLIIGRDQWGVWPVAVAAVVLLAAQIAPGRTSRAGHLVRSSAPDAPASVGTTAHVFALTASVGFGVLGLFLLRPDADDAFYVNRATWVAERGIAATNDTMFGPNTSPPTYGGGLPTPSIEALQGVLAHALGIQAPTLCYLFGVLFLGALSGWTTWRLIRAWAPRRHMLAMATSMVFLLASADSIVGNYSLGRIWQGKATAYAILLPLVWLLLSRTVVRISRGELAMLVVAGVAFVGMTTTSALLAPVVAGAALVAAGLLRSRSLALGAVAFLLAPVANGVTQALSPVAIGGDDATVTIPPLEAFNIASNGTSVAMTLLAMLAIVLSPRLAPRAVGVLLGCGAMATVVALLPGVFELANVLTGAGPVAWRLVITLPTWVLVGLLVTLPTGAGTRANAMTALAAVVIVIPVVFGTWLWRADGAQLTDRPTWKVDQAALNDVSLARDLNIPAGLWLMPPQQMEIVSISTVKAFAVVPRTFYLPGFEESAQDRNARQMLLRLASGRAVSASDVRGAIARLGVSLACVDADDDRARGVLRDAVGESLRPVGELACHVARTR